MSFDRRFRKRQGGQTPPQRPPERPMSRPPAEEKPILLPSLEPPAQTGRPGAISGYELTIAAQEISAVTSTESPTPNLQERARPPPIPGSRQAPTVQKEQSGEIESVTASFLSQIDQIEDEPVDEALVLKLESMLEEANSYKDAKLAEGGHSAEELAKYNNTVIRRLVELYEQARANMRFQASHAIAKRREPPAQLPMPSPGPITSTLSESSQTAQPQAVVQDEPAPAEGQRPGAFSRFITSPVTWAVVAASAFTGLFIQQKAFKEMAETLGMLPKTETPSLKVTAIVYGAVTVGLLAVTSLVNYLRNRSAEKRERQQNGGPTEYS